MIMRPSIRLRRPRQPRRLAPGGRDRRRPRNRHGKKYFVLDEAFLSTCAKPGLVEIIRANAHAFDYASLKPAGQTMKILRDCILKAVAAGQLDGYVPRECRFGSAEQLEAGE
jgi:hypothetical protein